MKNLIIITFSIHLGFIVCVLAVGSASNYTATLDFGLVYKLFLSIGGIFYALASTKFGRKIFDEFESVRQAREAHIEISKEARHAWKR